MTIEFGGGGLVVPEPEPTSHPDVVAGVRVGISLDPPQQPRWTILLRLILALPLLLVVEALSIAALFLVIAGWFAALVTKEVPPTIQEFVTSVLRVSSNVSAYTYLLVDRWPGIPFEAGSNEQVTLEIDKVSLNRAAVFFRYFLAIPAVFVQMLLTFGSWPFLFVMWVVGIIRGQTPKPLHQGIAAILRFQIRVQAYYFLLTPTQPFKGLFGDLRGNAGQSQLPPADEPPFQFLPEIAEPSAPPTELPTTWALTTGGRRTVKTALVFGVVGMVAYVALLVVVVLAADKVSARSAVQTSYTETVAIVQTYNQTVASCSTVTCITTAANTARVAVEDVHLTFTADYGSSLNQTSALLAYQNALSHLESAFALMASVTSTTQVQIVANQYLSPAVTEVSVTGNTLYVQLGGASNGSGGIANA